MPRNLPGRVLKWKPRGLSDSLDGSTSMSGAMAQLVNLIPCPNMREAWVPRPAAAALTTFGGFTSPAQINALLVVGNIAYGMIAETSGAFNGKDVPFAYNTKTNAFEVIAIPGGAASLPATPSALGDWTPPTMAVVGSRVVITHPGYAGGAAPFFGWLDISGFTDAAHTGSTHGTTTIDTLSANVLLAGWQVGMTITDASGDIPANTTIVAIASGGLSVTISNAATGSHAADALTVSGGTAAAPLYGAGNTNLTKLKAVPVAVADFNGRAYFAVPGNGMQFSDSLLPCQITNATQQLQPANGVDVTAFGGLAVSQTTGGILQALIAFQGDAQMQQVTGDPALNNLAMNFLGLGVGTLAPNTVTQTSAGLAFIAPDGFRVINYAGQVSDPIGANGDGVCVPFLNAVNPSRMCASFNQNVYRVSVQNGNAIGQPVQEYWYDFSLRVWSGPHSFPAALIDAFQGAPNHGFVMAASGINAALWSSSATPTSSDAYTENGIKLAYAFQTVLLPDTGEMAMNKMVQATLAAAIARQQTVTVQALDEQGNTIDTISLMGPLLPDTIWGSFTWGGAKWGGPATYLYRHPLFWHQPVIEKQMSLLVTGNSASGTVLGGIDMQIEQLGYLTEALG